MPRKLLRQQWQIFEQAALPQNVSQVQRQEMRRAFYSGGAVMFCLITAR